MAIMHRLERVGVDRFTLMLVATVMLASLLPATGPAAAVLPAVTDIAIAALFFLYGVRLPRDVVVAGLANWRLHLLVLASTFVAFPLLGLTTRVLVPDILSRDLYLGVVFLCTLPSTVQSSIAFTSIAGGNVAAAICSASASNLFGIVLTPVLAGILLSVHGGFSPHAISAIAVQLLLPFVAGQLVRPWLEGWARARRRLLSITDRGSILLVVYGAFSEAVRGGIWHQLPLSDFAALVAVNLALLAAVLALTTLVARALGYSRADEITIVFCGSKKSLASGIPMAAILFAGHPIGLIVLPVMLFHQIQLMVCAVLARRYAAAQAMAVAA